MQGSLAIANYNDSLEGDLAAITGEIAPLSSSKCDR
jgi:hypothetical protein